MIWTDIAFRQQADLIIKAPKGKHDQMHMGEDVMHM
jgi:hypothetical protein